MESILVGFKSDKKTHRKNAFDSALAYLKNYSCENASYKQIVRLLHIMLDYINDSLIECVHQSHSSSSKSTGLNLIIDKYQELCRCVFQKIHLTRCYPLIFSRHYLMISNNDIRETVFSRFCQILFHDMLHPNSYKYIDDSWDYCNNNDTWSNMMNDCMNYFIKKHLFNINTNRPHCESDILFSCVKCVELLAVGSQYQSNPILGFYLYNFVVHIFSNETDTILNYFNEVINIFIHYSVTVIASCGNIVRKVVESIFQKVFLFSDKYGKQTQTTVTKFTLFTLNLYFYDIYYLGDSSNSVNVSSIVHQLIERIFIFIENCIKNNTQINQHLAKKSTENELFKHCKNIIESLVIIKLIYSKWQKYNFNGCPLLDAYPLLNSFIALDVWSVDILKLFSSPYYLYMYLEINILWIHYSEGSLLSAVSVTILIENLLMSIRIMFDGDIKVWSSFYRILFTKCCDLVDSLIKVVEINLQPESGYNRWLLVIDEILTKSNAVARVLVIRLVCGLIKLNIIPTGVKLVNTLISSILLEQSSNANFSSLDYLTFLNIILENGSICEDFELNTNQNFTLTTNYLFRESLLQWLIFGITSNKFSSDDLLDNFYIFVESFVRILDRFGDCTLIPNNKVSSDCDRQRVIINDSKLHQRFRQMRLDLLFTNELSLCVHSTLSDNYKRKTFNNHTTTQLLIIPLFNAFALMVKNQISVIDNSVGYVVMFLLVIQIEHLFYGNHSQRLHNLYKCFSLEKIVSITICYGLEHHSSSLILLLVNAFAKLPKDTQESIYVLIAENFNLNDLKPTFLNSVVLTLACFLDSCNYVFNDDNMLPELSTYINDQFELVDLELFSEVFCCLSRTDFVLKKAKNIIKMSISISHHIFKVLAGGLLRTLIFDGLSWVDFALTILLIVTSHELYEDGECVARCINQLIQLPLVCSSSELLDKCVDCSNNLIVIRSKSKITLDMILQSSNKNLQTLTVFFPFVKRFLFQISTYYDRYCFSDVSYIFRLFLCNCSPPVSNFPLADYVKSNYLVVYNAIKMTIENNPCVTFYTIIFTLTWFVQCCSLYDNICGAISQSLIDHIGKYMNIELYRIKLYILSSCLLHFGQLPLQTIEQYKSFLDLLHINTPDCDIMLHQLKIHYFDDNLNSNLIGQQYSCELVAICSCMTMNSPNAIKNTCDNKHSKNSNRDEVKTIFTIKKSLINLFGGVEFSRIVDSFIDYKLESEQMNIYGQYEMCAIRDFGSTEFDIYTFCLWVFDCMEDSTCEDKTNSKTLINECLVQLIFYYVCKLQEVIKKVASLTNTIIDKIRLLWSIVCLQNIPVDFVAHILIIKLGSFIKNNNANCYLSSKLIRCVCYISKSVTPNLLQQLNFKFVDDFQESSILNNFFDNYLNYGILTRLACLSWLQLDHPILNNNTNSNCNGRFGFSRNYIYENGLCTLECMPNIFSLKVANFECVGLLHHLKSRFLEEFEITSHSYGTNLFVLIVVSYFFCEDKLVLEFLRFIPSRFTVNFLALFASSTIPIDLWIRNNCIIILNKQIVELYAQINHLSVSVGIFVNSLSKCPLDPSLKLKEFTDGCYCFWANQQVDDFVLETNLTVRCCLSYYFIFDEITKCSKYESLLELSNCVYSVHTSIHPSCFDNCCFLFSNSFVMLAELLQNDHIFGVNKDFSTSSDTQVDLNQRLKCSITSQFYTLSFDHNLTRILSILKCVLYSNDFILPNILFGIFDHLYFEENNFSKNLQSSMNLLSSVISEHAITAQTFCSPFYRKFVFNGLISIQIFLFKYILETKKSIKVDYLENNMIKFCNIAYEMNLLELAAVFWDLSDDLLNMEYNTNRTECSHFSLVFDLYDRLSSIYSLPFLEKIDDDNSLNSKISNKNNSQLFDIFNMDYEYFYDHSRSKSYSMVALDEIGLYGLMSTFDEVVSMKEISMEDCDHLFLKSALALTAWEDKHPTQWPYQQSSKSVKAFQNIFLHLYEEFSSDEETKNQFSINYNNNSVLEKSLIPLLNSNIFLRSSEYANTLSFLVENIGSFVDKLQNTYCSNNNSDFFNFDIVTSVEHCTSICSSWMAICNILLIKLVNPKCTTYLKNQSYRIFNQIHSNVEYLLSRSNKLNIIRFYLTGVEQANILPPNANALLKTLYVEPYINKRVHYQEKLQTIIEGQSKSPLDNIIKYYSYMAIGNWMNDTKYESNSNIFEHYFKMALSYAQHLDLSKQKQNDLHLCMGNFFYSLYINKKIVFNSAEYTSLKHEIANFQYTSKFDKNKKSRKRPSSTKKPSVYAKTMNTLMEDDLSYVKEIENEYYFYLKSAVEHYLQCFRISSRSNRVYIYRFLSLWFENCSNIDFNSFLRDKVNCFDLSLYLNVVWQLVSQFVICDQSKCVIFVELMKSLIICLAKAYPYHTIPILLSSKYYKNNKNEEPLLLKELLVDIRQNALIEYDSLINLWEFYHNLISFDGRNSAVEENFCTKIAHPIPVNLVRNYLKTESIKNPFLTYDYFSSAKLEDESRGMIFIESILNNSYHYAGGVNHPLILSMVCSDGVVRKQLLKSKDDLRQDAILQQAFVTVNELIAQYDSQPYVQAGFRQRTYCVIPLSSQCGLIEWCNNTIPFGSFINQSYYRLVKGRGADINGLWDDDECYKRMGNCTFSNKRRNFESVMKHRKAVLHLFFYEHFSNASDWFSAKCSYTNSTAVASMVGYILGLGDRHPWNILLDTSNAEVIHIDLGVAFEQGKMLPIPELVPFRLTQEVTDGFILKQCKQGLFFNICVKVLKLLRSHQTCILMIVRVLLDDPLSMWLSSSDDNPLVSCNKSPIAKSRGKDDKNISSSQYFLKTNLDTLHKNKIAEKVISKVKFKLNGMDSTENLSPNGQAKFLIEKASSFDNLCRIFHGWRPYM